MGYYSDNNNKVKNVYSKNVDPNNRSNNAAAGNNYTNMQNANCQNTNEVMSKSLINKMSNLNLNLTNKDNVSLVTQMNEQNAQAFDLSLKPNADMEKRNITQYCVS